MIYMNNYKEPIYKKKIKGLTLENIKNIWTIGN